MAQNRLLVSIAVMAATIMQVLDTTIVNVALPHMAGELGATPANISWVVTSYLVGSAILMPLTGFMTDRLGRRRYLLLSITGFIIASLLCGIATGLYQMVLFRLLQGLFGAALVPLSQAIMVEVFPFHERGKAMAIWGMGVMVAPILGPTLGGWLTDSYDWRWCFFINLPVGLGALALAVRHVPETRTRERDIDWLGFCLLAIAVGALQLMLDRGNDDDWFASDLIRAAAAASAVSFVLFIAHSLRAKEHPLFDLRVLKDRNFALASVVIAMFGLGLWGGQLLLPLYYQILLGFPAFASGLFTIPRGLGSLLGMILVGWLSSRITPKRLVLFGLLVSVLGSWLLTGVNAQTAGANTAAPLFIQGFGMGFIFVPMSTLAFSTIPKGTAPEAAGIYSLVRSIGSSVGVSIVATYYSRSVQTHWELLRGSLGMFRGTVAQYLAQLHLAPTSGRGVLLLGRELTRQAQLAGFVDAFWFVTASFVVMLPLVIFLHSGMPTERKHPPAAPE